MTDEFGGWHWDVFQAVIVFVADSCSSPAGKPLTPRRGRDELSRLCRPTGKELLLPERMGLTVLFSGACSQRLITWPEYKAWLLMPFFFFFLLLFQTTLKGFTSWILFLLGGDFYFKTLKRNSMLWFLPEGN